MALNIKDPETERLAAEVAALAGETKTGAIRTALRERKRRLQIRRPSASRRDALLALLENEIWPSLPPGSAGQMPTQAEQDSVLGYDEPA